MRDLRILKKSELTSQYFIQFLPETKNSILPELPVGYPIVWCLCGERPLCATCSEPPQVRVPAITRVKVHTHVYWFSRTRHRCDPWCTNDVILKIMLRHLLKWSKHHSKRHPRSFSNTGWTTIIQVEWGWNTNWMSCLKWGIEVPKNNWKDWWVEWGTHIFVRKKVGWCLR